MIANTALHMQRSKKIKQKPMIRKKSEKTVAESVISDSGELLAFVSRQDLL